MKIIEKILITLLLLGIIGALICVGYTLNKPPIINIDNSYFINKINELELKNKLLDDELRWEYSFRDERCVCKSYTSSYEPPMTKKEICNTPDDQLYFYKEK